MINTIILGGIIGAIYFYIMESSIPHYVNCSYVASVWTDILAFVSGAIIIYYGYFYKNRVLVLLGTTIITEHIMQLFGHKVELFTPWKTAEKKNYQPLYTKNVVDTLVRQSSRYAIASEQDESTLIALLHANYAGGYLWALKDIVNERTINEHIPKSSLKELEKYITSVQDKASQRATSECPQLVGPISNRIVASLAGDI